MNNLYRQKEKLEEKIMEQYKKMDNISPPKRYFTVDFAEVFS
jgi:hypothetical protein